MTADPSWSLAGRVAIVTGVSPGGIGETYAHALAGQGAAVIAADINEDGAAAVAAAIVAAGGRAIGVMADIADEASVAALVERSRSEFGGVDILVNNAALMVQMSKGPILEYSLDEWNRSFAVNLTGAFLCCRAVAPLMREQGWGRIVNQISAAAYPPVTAYGITKLALAGLTVALARELGGAANWAAPGKTASRANISVNGIAPGMVESAAGNAMSGEGSPVRAKIEEMVAKRGAGRREDLVGALLLLVSPAGDWITGQVLHVDGGWVMHP